MQCFMDEGSGLEMESMNREGSGHLNGRDSLSDRPTPSMLCCYCTIDFSTIDSCNSDIENPLAHPLFLRGGCMLGSTAPPETKWFDPNNSIQPIAHMYLPFPMFHWSDIRYLRLDSVGGEEMHWIRALAWSVLRGKRREIP